MTVWRAAICGMALATAAVSPSLAQSGHNEAALRKVIAANAKGECPEDLLAPIARGICLKGMPSLGNQIASLGTITKLQFLGVQSIMNAPPVEVYLLTFSNGASLVWTINVGPDDKVASVWISN